ncbi:hypothetical protein HYPSUDRAFT_167279 [Hypholoma sublateritium FD-334 SS-4]|uniref:GST N-terminal domain-containing protein n=1 Tax=Hypholoma sublateritium (strain FD-334 SS-4) TaxID=945553 RepID=A0A0D2MAA5_HYPSF|nr:hypothetical protein HYPSUDRAFT_167279 [Hypholoma sublateritium FD-334 SS-4]
MTIILYDLASALPEKAFAPNPWKVRFCLNYKGLPFKVEWVEFVDIESVYKKHEITPSKNADGSPSWVLPVIHDTDTGVSMHDSFAIAEYLEGKHSSPSLFPDNTIAFQSIFDEVVRRTALKSVIRFIVYDVYQIVNPASKEFIRRTREPIFGKPLEEIPPKGDDAVAQWAKVEAEWGTIDSWYKKSGGPYILGNTVSWADFVTACWIISARAAWGQDSPKWKDFTSWHGGRWGKLLGDLEGYQKIE